MDRKVMDYIFQKAQENGTFPADFFPLKTENLFIGIADDSIPFTEMGIKKGTLLFFDKSQNFKDGTPAIFLDQESGTMIVMKHRREGLCYAGMLVATLSMTAGV